MIPSGRRASLGVLLACVALAFAWLAVPPVASAHASRLSVDPPENAELSTGPRQVSATFNERLQTTFEAMNVIGPDGHLWSTGEPRVQGAVLSMDVMPLGPVGTYTVNYRVTSADGHVVSGSWSFRLTTPGTGTPGPLPAAAAGGGGGFPVWPLFLAAAALVVAGTWWALRRKRE